MCKLRENLSQSSSRLSAHFQKVCQRIICLFKSNRRISMLDRETVERLLQNNLDAKLNSELSKYGYQLDAAHKLFRFITSIFERTPPELITWKFKVIMPVGDWDFSQKIILNFHRMNEVFKVTWPAINNVALIEVKWLGDSGQTQYRDARANEGAKQLIDYLASSVQEEPDKHFVGYLTVFDGRRGKTSNQYERQEINYRSEYSSHPSMNYRRFYMAECV